MWSKHLILTMIQGDVEEFRRLLEKESANDLSLSYEIRCVEFQEPNVERILESAGALKEKDYPEESDDDEEAYICRASLLHVAAVTENIEFVKLLLEAGCDINSCNQFQQTVLHIAIADFIDRSAWNSDDLIRNESLIKFLLDHGADPNYQDDDGISPLHNAAKYQDPKIARMLIAKGACVNKRDNLGATPLHLATDEGSISVVKLLLDNDADIYNTDTKGDTPFTKATYRNDDNSYDVMKLLLERKGKCDKTSLYASKALKLALSNCDLRTIKLLSAYGAHITEDSLTKFTELHRAANNPHVDVIEYFLDHGIDVNVRTTTNLTPLHIAADYGRSEGCKFLLSRGADVNVNCTDDFSGTPLNVAISSFYFRSTKITLTGNKLEDRSDNNTVRNILIAHIAKLVFSNISVDKMNLQIIELDYIENGIINRERKFYYQNCIKELEKMKIWKIYEDVSLFNIYINKGMQSKYARNEDLIKSFDDAKDQLYHNFPIYYSLLKEDFYAEIKKQRLFNEAAIILNEIFNFPLYLINLKILNYLKRQDIIRINETE